jgi:cytochrome subunit of sulfide dehydrogenase
MKKPKLKFFVLGTLVLTPLIWFSCQKDKLAEEMNNNADHMTEQTTLKAASVDLPGRYLAANCFQCHGTNGYAGELKIAGMGSSEIISKFNSYKTKDPRSNIMYLHAQSYTDAEIQLIASYFSQQ